jgi:hypothetical protein
MTELKGLVASREKSAVARLHIAARQYATGNGIGDLAAGYDEPTHSIHRVHPHEGFAFAHEIEGETFRQCAVPHGRFPRCLTREFRR